MTITFHVPGEAVGKAIDYRIVGKPPRQFIKPYKSTPTKQWMKLVADLARQAFGHRDPWEGPICVEIEITRRLLQTSKKRQQAMLAGRILPTTKPDNDNVEKCVFDAMSGIVYGDDAQIVRNVTTKQFGAREGVTIKVSRWARGASW
jgi:Holliday junction resolvase RusA-like endonuclease